MQSQHTPLREHEDQLQLQRARLVSFLHSMWLSRPVERFCRWAVAGCLSRPARPLAADLAGVIIPHDALADYHRTRRSLRHPAQYHLLLRARGFTAHGSESCREPSVYSDQHLGLLADISRLKDEGLPLRAVKERLASKVAAARALDVDLVAEQNEQTRQAILAAAARLFVRKGYKRTRVTDIIDEVGITAPVFYGHFRSKQDLFVEAFGLFVSWMRGFLESGLRDEPDPAARDLARVHGYLGVQTLSPDMMSLVRSEALHEDDALRRVVERSYKDMTQDTLDDLSTLRRESGTSLPASDELMAYGLLGAWRTS